MARKRWKRKSGVREERSTIKACKDFIIQNCLEPRKFYDDWVDWRDSFRDWFKDGKKIKKNPFVCNCDRCIKRRKRNKKQKRLSKRRKVKNTGL